jgi:hypothetical protein
MRAFRTARTPALLALAASIAGCGANERFVFDGGPDGGDTDTIDTETESESETETQTETEAVDAGDTDPGEAGPGEPCWKESFGASHPNAGLPNCGLGYVCIGDATGAWCSETCGETGDIDTSAGPFDGWCCGEFSNPCDPALFWVPTELSPFCVPRTAGLVEACTNGGTWPSTDVRCAPRCDGTSLVGESVCNINAETPYCTISCGGDTDATCQIEDAFLGGCCQLFGVSYLCATASMCGS